MSVSRRRIARSVADQLMNGVSIDQIAPRLAAYLIDNNLAKHQDEMIGDIAYELAKSGRIEAVVTTARPLSDELRDHVYAYLKRHETATDIVLDERVDASILGGIIIETPSRQLDASVSSRLKELKTS